MKGCQQKNLKGKSDEEQKIDQKKGILINIYYFLRFNSFETKEKVCT